MAQGSRPDRIADQIRSELGELLAREVHDPGLGFVTITRVQVSADLQQARVFYTALGEERVRRNSERAPGPLMQFPGVPEIEIAQRVDGQFDAAIIMECGDLGRTGVAGLDK